jgi:hypothetical protein
MHAFAVVDVIYCHEGACRMQTFALVGNSFHYMALMSLVCCDCLCCPVPLKLACCLKLACSTHVAHTLQSTSAYQCPSTLMQLVPSSAKLGPIQNMLDHIFCMFYPNGHLPKMDIPKMPNAWLHVATFGKLRQECNAGQISACTKLTMVSI